MNEVEDTPRVSRADRCAHPHNQPAFDCLKNIHQRPNIPSGYQATLKIAMKSIKKYPLPIHDAKEAMQLHGVGERIAENIVYAIRKANTENSTAVTGRDTSQAVLSQEKGRPLTEESGPRKTIVKRDSPAWYLLITLHRLQSSASFVDLSREIDALRKELSRTPMKSAQVEDALDKLNQLELVTVERDDRVIKILKLTERGKKMAAKYAGAVSIERTEPAINGKRLVSDISMDITQEGPNTSQPNKKAALIQSDSQTSISIVGNVGHFISVRSSARFEHSSDHRTVLRALFQLGKPARQSAVMVVANQIREADRGKALCFSEMRTAIDDLTWLGLVCSDEGMVSLSFHGREAMHDLGSQSDGKLSTASLSIVAKTPVLSEDDSCALAYQPRDRALHPSNGQHRERPIAPMPPKLPSKPPLVSSTSFAGDIVVLDEDSEVSNTSVALQPFIFEIPTSPSDLRLIHASKANGEPAHHADFFDLTQEDDNKAEVGRVGEDDVICIEDEVEVVPRSTRVVKGCLESLRATSIFRRLENITSTNATIIASNFCSVRGDESFVTIVEQRQILNPCKNINEAARVDPSQSLLSIPSQEPSSQLSCAVDAMVDGIRERKQQQNVSRPRPAYSRLRPLPEPLSEYEVLLLVDERERKEKDTICSGLASDGLAMDVCTLSVGDYLFVCRAKGAAGLDDAYVLDCIIERKIAHDLAQSIIDGRWKEQKFRIKQSGLRHALYLMEGDLVTLYNGSKITATHLKTAAIQAPVCFLL